MVVFKLNICQPTIRHWKLTCTLDSIRIVSQDLRICLNIYGDYFEQLVDTISSKEQQFNKSNTFVPEAPFLNSNLSLFMT